MIIIDAVKKDKDGITIYYFSVDNEEYEAHYTYGTALAILHNGIQIGVVEKPKDKVLFTVNTGQSTFNITAWFDFNLKDNVISRLLIGKAQGAGIKINDNPVQYTLADPNTYIKGGKNGLLIFLFLYAFKSIFQIVSGDSFVAILYIIPFFIFLVAVIQYQKWLSFSLIAGVILALIEVLDFTSGIGDVIVEVDARSLPSMLWFLFIIGIRTKALCYLFRALKWKSKVKAS